MAKYKKYLHLLTFLSAISPGFFQEDRNTKICDCPSKLEPVCASNKKVFRNPCEFRCFKKFHPEIEIVKRAVCASCAAPGGKQPVCGSSGVIYRNMMEFECNKRAYPEFRLEVRELRYCTLCDCPRFFREEICGSNGVLYTNRCDFECFKRVFRDGEVLEVDMEYCLSDVFA